MRFRWTMKQLEEFSDARVLRGLVVERKSELNPFTPLSKRLSALCEKLDKKVQAEEMKKQRGDIV